MNLTSSRAFVALFVFSFYACGGAAATPTGPTAVPPVAGATPAPATLAPGVDKIFDPNVLHEVRFTLDPEAWAALKENYLLNDFYEAAVTIDGESAGLAGIRSRGGGTRSGTKPGIKITFDKFVNKQTFHGLKSVNLKNVLADESMLREYLALQVYQAMGIPTPAGAMAHLVVNGEDGGVFTMVEQIDKTWLTARYGENSGDLFSYQWVDSWNFSFRGENPDAFYPQPFEPETNANTFDPQPLIDLDYAANYADDGDLLTALSPYLDVSAFITYLASEAALGESDGFMGDQGVNNLYAYKKAGTTRFNLIPWDRDSCLRDADRPLDQGAAENILASRLLARPDLQSQFIAKGNQAIQSYMNPTWLGSRLETGFRLIHSAALADEKKPFANTDFEAGVVGLRGVIAARATHFGWKES